MGNNSNREKMKVNVSFSLSEAIATHSALTELCESISGETKRYAPIYIGAKSAKEELEKVLYPEMHK